MLLKESADIQWSGDIIGKGLSGLIRKCPLEVYVGEGAQRQLVAITKAVFEYVPHAQDRNRRIQGSLWFEAEPIEVPFSISAEDRSIAFLEMTTLNEEVVVRLYWEGGYWKLHISVVNK